MEHGGEMEGAFEGAGTEHGLSKEGIWKEHLGNTERTLKEH
jgi:hypothetical protein